MFHQFHCIAVLNLESVLQTQAQLGPLEDCHGDRQEPYSDSLGSAASRAVITKCIYTLDTECQPVLLDRGIYRVV